MQEPLSTMTGSETLDALSAIQPMHNKPLQHLGMAKKAGLLAIGSDAVKSAAMSGKARLIVVTTDISGGSARQAKYYAEDSGALFVETPYSKFEFGRVAGRGSPGVLAILDTGLAEGFIKKLVDIDGNRYKELAEKIQEKAAQEKVKQAKKEAQTVKAKTAKKLSSKKRRTDK